ncbi:uncharacterized protein LOC131327654 [Rhododendron vialii]|uniref:uncharacterized protein LOC131327654 n=1 Tax=Rhododendron vialii TaxID=182163 RepID=UPI00265E94C2|nr:uncharacterized protein LOC131327654 [Rhododendron vialii]
MYMFFESSSNNSVSTECVSIRRNALLGSRKKDTPFVWIDRCQAAFTSIQKYLQNPPVLMPPIPGKPLILYLSVNPSSMGCLLAQEGDKGVEKAIYYLKFDLEYVTRKSVKGRAVAEFLANHPIDGPEDSDFVFPDEEVLTVVEDVWTLYFDGAANQNGYGIGVLLITPDGSHIPLAFKLNFDVTNNQTEYEVREEKLKLYHQDLEDLIPRFNKVTFTHIPLLKNQFADALATLVSMVKLPLGDKLRPILIEQRDYPAYQYVNSIDDVGDGLPWCHDIWNFVESGKYPADASKKDQLALRRIAAQYILCGGKLYKRSHCGMHKLCVSGSEATRIMEEVHEGVCGPHMSGVMLARKILRQGYFWFTMESQYEYENAYMNCFLFGMTSHWPFSVWGIDVIGMIRLSASNGHRFILVAIDYFTKWVEAESFKTLTAVQVAHFIRKNIIYRYGVPQAFVSDNGTHFKGRVLELFEKFGIQIHHSIVYRPQTNGAVEVANKNIETIIKKSVESARDWHEQLLLALWGYRTSIRTLTGATPYSLVYGMEAVLPIELEVLSLKIMAEIARAFNKKVKSRNLVEGDMVIKEIRAPVFDPHGKFRPKRSGPYFIKTILSGGAAQLIDLDSNEFSTLVNLDQLKRCLRSLSKILDKNESLMKFGVKEQSDSKLNDLFPVT